MRKGNRRKPRRRALRRVRRMLISDELDALHLRFGRLGEHCGKCLFAGKLGMGLEHQLVRGVRRLRFALVDRGLHGLERGF